jgi:hypothetical protein
MANVEKADISMYDGVHELLGDFGRPLDWRSLFTHGWDTEEKCPGYVIIDQGRIVGFIATIFSDRLIDGRIERFCNLSSWIVRKQQHDTYSGNHLLKAAFARQDIHISSLSAREGPTAVSKSLGLKVLDDRVRVVPDALNLITCRKCGGKLKIVAYLHDLVAIKQVLAHLGLSPPEEPKPPPAVHEVVRVPVDEEGREMQAP